MLTRPFFVHALSPLHSGVGQVADVIDLPIARQRATGIPYLPGSSIKGVLRDAADPVNCDVNSVFGPDTRNASDHAGALIIGDARLLALPVRSFKGTFAWVSSPLLLQLALRDLGGVGSVPTAVPAPQAQNCAVASLQALPVQQGHVYLEDLDLAAVADNAVRPWGAWLETTLNMAGVCLANRFVVVPDEVMTFLWETATQVDARVRISSETRTVASGALWLEESLPPETILIGLAAADRGRGKNALSDVAVLDSVLTTGDRGVFQFGGKATVGRGRCRVVAL